MKKLNVKSEKNYITPAGLKRLLDERDFLTKTERPEVVKVVSWAASLGDRSENADYQYGKRKLREIDRRVRFLNTRINTSQEVDPLKQTGNQIKFGATVSLVDLDGVEKTYAIVGVDEIDSSKNYISWKSPIGKSLIGKEQGDEVVVITPAGPKEYEIGMVCYKEIEARPISLESLYSEDKK